MVGYVVACLVAVAGAAVLTPLARGLALRVNAVDVPGARKIHSRVTPRLGGVGVGFAAAIALIVSCATGLVSDGCRGGLGEPAALLGVGLLGLLFLVGVLDDSIGLGAGSKALLQFSIAGVAVWGGYAFTGVSLPGGGHLALGVFGAPLSILWIVGITNAINLIDGIDGLAGGVSVVALGTLLGVSLLGGDLATALLAAALLGAVLGFLIFNFNPASIFLGDSGSLLLGGFLALFSIRAGQKGTTAFAILVPLLAMGVPVADTLLAMVRRFLRALRVVRPEGGRYRFFVIAGRSMFQADRGHIHHRLLDLGLTQRRAALVLYGVSIALGATAFLIASVRNLQVGFLLAAVGVLSVVAFHRLGYRELSLPGWRGVVPLLDRRICRRRFLHVGVDVILAFAAFVGALVLAGMPPVRGTGRWILLELLPVLIFVRVGTYYLARVYRTSWRKADLRDVKGLTEAVLLGSLVSYAMLQFLPAGRGLATRVFLLDALLLLLMTVGVRMSYRVLQTLRGPAEAERGRPAVVFGSGEDACAALRNLRVGCDGSHRVLGFYDSEADPGIRVNGLPVFQSGAALAEIARKHEPLDLVVPASAASSVNGQLEFPDWPEGIARPRVLKLGLMRFDPEPDPGLWMGGEVAMKPQAEGRL